MADITLSVKATDINDVVNKADKSLSNITSEAKEETTRLSFPSGKYDDLTLGASGTIYTAPADGYVYLVKSSGISSSSYCGLANDTRHYSINNTAYGVTTMKVRMLLPVCKNDEYHPFYNMTGDVDFFRFIYAEGEK